MLNIFKSATKSTFDQMALDLVSERGNQTCPVVQILVSCLSQLCDSLYAIAMNLPLYRVFPPTLWQDMIWCFPDPIHVIVQSYHQVALERVASKTLSSPVVQRARPLLVPLRTTLSENVWIWERSSTRHWTPGDSICCKLIKV